jgi:hypothetical protein
MIPVKNNQPLVALIIAAFLIAGFAQAATLQRTEGEDRYGDSGSCQDGSVANQTVSGASSGTVLMFPGHGCWAKLSTASVSTAAVMFRTYQPVAGETDCFVVDVYTIADNGVESLQGTTQQHCGFGFKPVQVLNSGAVQHFSGNPIKIKAVGTRLTGGDTRDMGIDYVEYVSGSTTYEGESAVRTSGTCATIGSTSITLAGAGCWAEWDFTLPANSIRMDFRSRIASGIGLDSVTLAEKVDGTLVGSQVISSTGWATRTFTDLSSHTESHTVRLELTVAYGETPPAKLEIDWLAWVH